MSVPHFMVVHPVVIELFHSESIMPASKFDLILIQKYYIDPMVKLFLWTAATFKILLLGGSVSFSRTVWHVVRRL